MRKVLLIFISILLALNLCACGSKEKDDLSQFYDKVSNSQELLDVVADDIYSNWYDAIYKDEFDEDINLAIAMAQLDHEADLEKIEKLDKEISTLFKRLKEHKNFSLIKDVMSAYSDYYEFVVNVSGSFETYSAEKEPLKKELASLLRDLSYEL